MSTCFFFPLAGVSDCKRVALVHLPALPILPEQLSERGPRVMLQLRPFWQVSQVYVRSLKINRVGTI